ncbi:PAS domain S-box protein [bacterium]|nr:PAS domain S-box protein [candidate division CSSED10-310 bacterium]
MRVIICSKDIEAIDVIRKIVNDLRFDVIVCANGPENICGDGIAEIDLAICDIDHEQNGEGIGHLIAQGIPVIGLRDAANPWTNAQPVLQVIVKPVDGDERDRLKQAISGVSRINKILKASRFHRKLLDSIPDVVMVIDNDYRVARMNRSMVVHLSGPGKTIDSGTYRALLGRKCYEIMFDRPKPCNFYGDPCPMQAILAGSTLSESIITCADRHYQVTMTPLFEIDESPAFFVEVIRDITVRTRTLRGIEQRYLFEQILARAGAEMIQSAVLKTPMDGVDRAVDRVAEFIHADQWYISMSRYPFTTWETEYMQEPGNPDRTVESFVLPEALIQWPVFRQRLLEEGRILHVPDLAQRPADDVPTCLAGQPVRSLLMIPIMHKDGIVRILGMTAQNTQFDWPADILTILRVFGDSVSHAIERNMNAIELRHEEERYRRLTENLPDMIWRVRNDGIVEYVNPAIQAILGFDRNRVTGSPIASYLETPVLDRIQHFLHRMSITPQSPRYIRFREDLRHQDGRMIPCEIGITWDRNEFGTIKAFEGIVRDLSEIQQAEKEKAQLQHRFYQSQRMEAIGSLASGIAHEINNPIGIIIGFAEFLIDSSDLPDQQIENIRLIHQEAIRIKEITQRLLDYARSGHMEMKPMDINQPIADCIKLIDHAFKQRRIRVLAHLTPSVPHIIGCANAIKQVVMNLLINAMEAIPKNIPGVIAVRTIPTESRGVRVEIADNGVGIADELKDKIFMPFFSGKEKGSGLGLSISSTIIEQHQGFLSCTSKPGAGTTFIIELPAAETDAVEAGGGER